jgi:DmsE family decaheme c-type cytochrome
MRKYRMRLLHFMLLFSLAGAVGLAMSVNRTLSAEEAETPAESAVPPSSEPTPMPSASPPASPAPMVVHEMHTGTSPKAEFVGAEACAACHSDQVEAFKNDLHGKMFPKHKGISFDKSCETCHGPASLHVNAGGDKTDPGFRTVKITPANVGKTCAQCHSKSHWEGSPHARANVSCSQCHTVHSPKNSKAQLKTAKVEDTCYTCHSDVKGQMRRSSHMPLAEGKMGCGSCHDPHGTGTPKNLKAASLNQLCFQCHQDKRGPHLWEHAPVKENCSNCHSPHGSHHDKMLKTKMPLLCQRCHAFTRHPGTLYDANDAKNGHNRIFNSSCINCHPNIHGSNHPSGKTFTR